MFYEWSFDEKSFFFGSNKRDKRFMDVYEMDTDTLTAVLVYQNDIGLELGSVSRDKRFFAFRKVITEHNTDIYLLDRETEELKHLTPHEGDVYYDPQTFNVDSKSLYYLTNEDCEFNYLKKYDIKTGTSNTIEKTDHFTVKQFGRDEFVNKKNPEKIDIEFAQQGLAHAQKIISEGKHDVVILDEINVAVDFGLIKIEDVIKIIETKPSHVELILTGRYAPSELAKYANLISEICEIKHPYTNGVLSRKGIDW